MDAQPEGVEFREAIEFFRQKLRLPTRGWTDIWQGAHSRAFVVAGATSDALLADFQAAILKAMEEGRTLADFRADFDRIVATHGWSHRGSAGWRSRVIYQTNLRTAHAAGRWAQIERLKARRPYLRYVAVMDARTRPLHAAWHGTILHVDDPWWRTHFPPNGWNCRCIVQSLSQRDLDRHGWTVSPQAPPTHMVDTVIHTVDGPAVVPTPHGIDAGFGYNPGIAWEGSKLPVPRPDRGAWPSLTPPGAPPPRLPGLKPQPPPAPPPGTAPTQPGPAPSPVVLPPQPGAAPAPAPGVSPPPPATPPIDAPAPGGPGATPPPAAPPVEALRPPAPGAAPSAPGSGPLQPGAAQPTRPNEGARGESERLFGPRPVLVDPVGGRVVLDQSFYDHIDAAPAGRRSLLWLLPELVRAAAEVWIGFRVDVATGRAAVRRRYVRSFGLGGRTLVLVAQFERGRFAGVRLIRPGSSSGRSGVLLYRDPDQIDDDA